MKLIYEAPELDIVKFTTEDIITTSGLENGGVGDGDETGWGAVNGV